MRVKTCTAYACSSDICAKYHAHGGFPTCYGPEIPCKDCGLPPRAHVGEATRSEVYAALNSERDYQDEKHHAAHGFTSSANEHSVTEFLVYMRSYVNEALEIVSRQGDPEATAKALDIVRKVGGLAVAAMERHGAPLRGR